MFWIRASKRSAARTGRECRARGSLSISAARGETPPLAAVGCLGDARRCRSHSQALRKKMHAAAMGRRVHALRHTANGDEAHFRPASRTTPTDFRCTFHVHGVPEGILPHPTLTRPIAPRRPTLISSDPRGRIAVYVMDRGSSPISGSRCGLAGSIDEHGARGRLVHLCRRSGPALLQPPSGHRHETQRGEPPGQVEIPRGGARDRIALDRDAERPW